MYYSSAVMLDAERLFVSEDTNTKRNFILDINTYEWTEVAERIYEPYRRGNVGTFFNSTANEIQVAHIEKYGIEIYSPRSDTWHTDMTYPPEMTYLSTSAAIQQGQDSFVLIGGDDSGQYSGGVYRFDENGFKILNENALTVPRDWHVAISIPIEQFNC